MKKDLLDEIIQLKEEKKILEAACGNVKVDHRIFSHKEELRIRELRGSNQSCDMLKDVEKRIHMDERELRNWTS
jgi:hypothetical protein